MSRTIYKYPLTLTDLQSIELPPESQVLSVGLDPNGVLSIWVSVNPDVSYNTEHYIFWVIGTGNTIPEDAISYGEFLGSVAQGSFVWHIFYS